MIKLKEIIKELKIPINMRVHASNKPVTIRNIIIPQTVDIKPKGLWYSFGDDWIKWSKENMEYSYKYFYQVIFPTSKHIAKLNSKEDALKFTEKYMPKSDMVSSMIIDWPMVARDYDGIEIQHYNEEIRFQVGWCSGLDVPSGCIWNLSNIQLKELI